MKHDRDLRSPLGASRLSDYFQLGLAQPALDFVDIDVEGDLPVFLDPTALLGLRTSWAGGCVALLQDFFQHILELLREGRVSHARSLLAVLREPNETHLGLSQGVARGRGLGATSSGWLCDALQRSQAVHTGLLEHLEDSILMIPGVAGDLVSDITTNLIRAPLIEYTASECESLGIPLQHGLASGPLWDPERHEWHTTHVSQPMGPRGRLLLVPKILVRRHLEYDYEEYYQHYLLAFLQNAEMEQKTGLVKVLKSGPRVYKKDLEAKYGRGKNVVVDLTLQHPEVLAKYRQDKRQQRRLRRPPLTHEQIAEVTGTRPPDLGSLLDEVRAVAPGNESAAAYHSSVFKLLKAVFYPALSHARKEQEIHEGLKRIDIAFDNDARSGFFDWLAGHFPAPVIFIECKNYGRELGNPELDQMIGRLSPSRGRFGMIVCRSLEDPETFHRRCQNTADDDHGFIIALTDDDLAALVEGAKQPGLRALDFPLLRDRFQRLLFRAEVKHEASADPSSEGQADVRPTPEESA